MSHSSDQEFERLFKEFYPSVVSFFRRQGFHPENAHDLAQEVFLSAYRGFSNYHRDASIKTWLFKITRNVHKNALRSRKALKRSAPEVRIDMPQETGPQLEVESREESPEISAFRAEQTQHIQKAIESLPTRMRQCMKMSLQGHSYGETAKLLGISISTLRSQLFEARKKLKDLLADDLLDSKRQA